MHTVPGNTIHCTPAASVTVDVTFRRFRKIAKNNYWLLHVCLFVCLSVLPSVLSPETIRIPLDRFSLNLFWSIFLYWDSLRAGRSGDRIPVGARFSALVQTDPGAYPASYTMGTGSFPEVKRLGRGVEHPTMSSAEVKERVVILLLPCGPSWPLLGLTLPLP
jgi:hypothetical protein